jgi:NAD-dependent oxidoreductase involved in siderophore biosynthesis
MRSKELAAQQTLAQFEASGSIAVSGEERTKMQKVLQERFLNTLSNHQTSPEDIKKAYAAAQREARFLKEHLIKLGIEPDEAGV